MAEKLKPYEGFISRFPRAILAVTEVSQHGTKKKGIPLDDVEAFKKDGADYQREAKTRHMINEAIEGIYDKEFMCLHAAHEAWRAMARLECLLNNLNEGEEYVKEYTLGYVPVISS